MAAAVKKEYKCRRKECRCCKALSETIQELQEEVAELTATLGEEITSSDEEFIDDEVAEASEESEEEQDGSEALPTSEPVSNSDADRGTQVPKVSFEPGLQVPEQPVSTKIPQSSFDTQEGNIKVKSQKLVGSFDKRGRPIYAPV